ncbi:unnamed protein product [Rhodiola kirilowii]
MITFTPVQHILYLFDSIWFEQEIISMEQSSKNQQPQTAIHKNQHFQGQIQDNEDEEEAKIIQLQLLQVAKTIHFTNSSSVSESPTSVLPSPKRQTILQQRRKLNGRNRRSCGKSVAELEFEELEGFRDLGFVFSEEDRKDSTLVQIVPGLKRLAKGGDEGVERLMNDHRPYLSEAWDAMEKKEDILKRTVLINRSIQEMGNDQNETLLKGLIKSWAHSVASAVR